MSTASDQYATFQKFSDLEEALSLLNVLKEHNIQAVFEDDSASFDPTFSNNPLTKEYRIKLVKADFEKTRQLLLTIYSSQLESVDPNHYLFGFTDEELMEIVAKQNEWSFFDFLLAQKILKDRGKEFKPGEVEALWKKRIQELAAPEKKQTGWIIFGYICAFGGGLLGMFIGWYLSRHKKTLPDGSIVYAHLVSDRKHGYLIFIISVIFFIFWIIRSFIR